MKNRTIRKFLAAAVVFAIMSSFILPQSAQAASYKKKINKLLDNMWAYEYTILFETGLSTGEGYEVVLSDAEKAKAAALTAPLTEDTLLEETGELGWEYIYSVSPKRIKTMSKKLFGKAVSYKKLPKLNSIDEAAGFLCAYRNNEGKPVIYSWEGETETLYENVKTTIKKDGGKYTVVKDVFHGYWGLYSGWLEYYNKEFTNYRITYKIEKNSASSYGYVITGMTVEKTADDSYPDPEE